MQYNFNREAAKTSALSTGKINKYEYLTGEEILPSNRQAKFTYSSLVKAFEKQTKAIEEHWIKQIKTNKSNWKQSQKNFLETDQKSIAWKKI